MDDPKCPANIRAAIANAHQRMMIYLVSIVFCIMSLNLRSSIYTGMYLFFFFSQATGQTDQCTVNDDGSWISILVSGHSDYTGAQLEVTNVHEVYSPQGEGELNAKCKYIPLYFRCSNKVSN